MDAGQRSIPCLLPRDMPQQVWDLLESLLGSGIPLPHRPENALVCTDSERRTFRVDVES